MFFIVCIAFGDPVINWGRMGSHYQFNPAAVLCLS